MQTFLPVASTDFRQSATVLDDLRLNKQALEAWQILMNLLELNPQGDHRTPRGWKNHPAVLMWRGHEEALHLYIQAMVEEWLARGHKTIVGDKALQTISKARNLGLTDGHVTMPSWITDSSTFHQVAASHREALLWKNYEWYQQFNWTEDPGTRPETYNYVWPVPSSR
jgi:Pyrimidine dimer DNA glycosylase